MSTKADSQSVSFLEKSFAFYGAYHNNKVNQWIHIICVWPIFWTAMLFVSHTSPPSMFENTLVGGYPVNWAMIIGAFYFAFYFLIEFPGIGGTICSALVVSSFVTVNHVKNTVPNATRISIVVHVVCWLAQFYGHGVYEGRSPALLDNLFGAIVMAPFFVIMEVLFMLGYRPDLQKKVQLLVDENIKAFKDSKKVKK